jgi:hypothetical protein
MLVMPNPSALPEHVQHRDRDVDRHDAANHGCGGERERPGPCAEVHHRGLRAKSTVDEQRDIRRRIELLLPVVGSDERIVQMLRACVLPLFDHPGPRHRDMLAPHRWVMQ